MGAFAVRARATGHPSWSGSKEGGGIDPPRETEAKPAKRVLILYNWGVIADVCDHMKSEPIYMQ